MTDAVASWAKTVLMRERAPNKRAALEPGLVTVLDNPKSRVLAGACEREALGAESGKRTQRASSHILAGGTMAKKRVFVSFDFDNDKVLKDFIVGQARLPDSPFEVIDTSLKEAAPMKTWEDKARVAIKRSDIVVVMVGPHTHKAPGVLKEVRMARDAGIPIVQVIGYKDGNYTAVPNAGRLYAWNWENLKKLIG